MRIFNRIAMILILSGLFVLGLLAVLYSFDLLGYRLTEVQNDLGLSSLYNGLEGFVGSVEDGGLSPLGIATLVLVAIIGLILLIAELKPARRRRVRMREGAYVTRGAVRREVIAAADRTRHVLNSTAKVKAKRRPGALVKLQASVRRGEDLKAIENDLRNSVQRRLGESGVPVSKLKIKLTESDPRQTKTRVQ